MAPPQEVRGSIVRPFLGPRSSSSELVEQFCMFGSSSPESVLLGVNAGRCLWLSVVLRSSLVPFT
eukprot:3654862-Alexandrium_andersonii.AAC.1